MSVFRLGDKQPQLGANAWIAPNATVIGDVRLGANTLIPEGKVFPDNVLIVGSPGKVVRQLTAEEGAGLQYSAEHYVTNAQRYQDTLTPL